MAFLTAQLLIKKNPFPAIFLQIFPFSPQYLSAYKSQITIH